MHAELPRAINLHLPLPHEFLINRELMGQLYPSFEKGLVPFFSGQWNEYSDFLTFKGSYLFNFDDQGAQ